MKKIISALVFTGFIFGAQAQSFYLFVGTYTKGTESKGIYVYRINVKKLKFDSVNVIASVNPSYLAINKTGDKLYAVNETNKSEPGAVSAYAFNPKKGRLSFLNQGPSGGDDPCYVSVDDAGKWLAVANYSGGSLGILPLKKDGSIDVGKLTVLQYEGKGLNTVRQEKPHLHTAMFIKKDKQLITTDLGTDQLRVDPINVNKKSLIQSGGYTLKLNDGNGPRHLAFHEKLPVFYVIEELSGTVAVMDFKGKIPQLKQRIISDSITRASLDKGSADIHLSPDGKFLYTSNRAEANTISIFSINQKTGMLKFVSSQSVMGTRPRNFIIDPSGKYLLVANQGTNSIVVFVRSIKTGLLQLADAGITVPSPVCLKLLAVN